MVSYLQLEKMRTGGGKKKGGRENERRGREERRREKKKEQRSKRMNNLPMNQLFERTESNNKGKIILI